MRLDQIALIFTIIISLSWFGIIITGAIAALPFGLPILFIFAIFGYLLICVIKQRLDNKEDDHYERNIKE